MNRPQLVRRPFRLKSTPQVTAGGPDARTVERVAAHHGNHLLFDIASSRLGPAHWMRSFIGQAVRSGSTCSVEPVHWPFANDIAFDDREGP